METNKYLVVFDFWTDYGINANAYMRRTSSNILELDYADINEEEITRLVLSKIIEKYKRINDNEILITNIKLIK